MNLRTTLIAIIFPLCTTQVFSSTLPDDEHLAELYEYSCMACHASSHSGAPLTGDSTAWAPRIDKGLEQLLNNTIDGIRGMPALGSCSDCTIEDFEALIIFMSGMKQETQP